jgi:O-antigen ligase
MRRRRCDTREGRSVRHVAGTTGASGSRFGDRLGFSLLLLFAAVGPFLSGPSAERARPAWGGGSPALLGSLLICLFAFLAGAATLMSGSSIALLRPLAVPLGAATALALLGIGQSIALPEGLLERLAPVNLKIYHETEEILRVFGRPSPSARISIAPTETVWAVLRLAAVVAFFCAAAGGLTTRPRRRLFFWVLLASAVSQVVLACATSPPGARVRAAFQNADHFAGYLEIALAVSFGALWAEVLTNRERAGESWDKAERFEKRFAPMALRVLVWGAVAAGIVLTQSRGGVLAAGITMLVLLALALAHGRARRRATAAALAFVALGAVLVVLAAGEGRFHRFLEEDPRDFRSNARVVLWRSALEAWRTFPIVGSGLGTFREAIRRVQPRGLHGLIEQAHDDGLQILVTGGVVGAALAIVLIVSLSVALIRAWRAQVHREESAFQLAGIGALLTLVLHGLVEFNLSIPVIPATLACVLGASWSAGARSRGIPAS